MSTSAFYKRFLAVGIFVTLFSTALPLLAQDTVIGLNFEMSYSMARDSLESKGFASLAGEELIFINEDGDTRVELGFADVSEGMKFLSISIFGDKPDELEAPAIQMLTAFHGDHYDYDPDMREAWWKLDEFHFLNAAVVEEEGAYVIFYGDIREDELNPY